ncbi:MAG: amidohydrolase family protein [Rhodoplanes sp.]
MFADIERRLADFDQLRLETMDKAGIDLAVLSVTTPGVQAEKDTNTAIKLAREANDLLAREVQKRPQRYAGFAHLPTQDGGAAAAELERAVKDLRFKGALINGQTNGKYLDANMYLPFWERVQDLDVPIYLHPGELADHPAMFAGRPELNGPVWAWTADTGAHALRLVFAGTFTRFPKLKIILGHMGETLPFLLWRFDSRWQLELGEDLQPDARPSAIIKRHFAITTSGVCDPGPLAEAIGALGGGQCHVLGRLSLRGLANRCDLHRIRTDQRGSARQGLPGQRQTDFEAVNGTWQTLTTTFGFAASRFALSITSSSANRNRVRRIQGDCHPSKRRALYCETARKARTFTSVRDASGNRGRGSRGTHANDLPISTRHGFRHDADPGSRP